MQSNSSQSILFLLSDRIKAYRIHCQITQADLAAKSGVSLRSIQNFEHGKDLQLSNLIKLLKALDLGENLDLLIPDVSKRPSAYLDKNKKRERARKNNRLAETPFQWEDEK